MPRSLKASLNVSCNHAALGFPGCAGVILGKLVFDSNITCLMGSFVSALSMCPSSVIFLSHPGRGNLFDLYINDFSLLICQLAFG